MCLRDKAKLAQRGFSFGMLFVCYRANLVRCGLNFFMKIRAHMSLLRQVGPLWNMLLRSNYMVYSTDCWAYNTVFKF